jgi:hypothetical protein
MPFGDYGHFQRFHTSRNANVNQLAADTSQTLITVRSAGHQLWIQKITYVPDVVAAQAITIKDTTGTPVLVGLIPASQATPYVIDFGPEGVPLAIGKNLVTANTAGPAGQFHVEAYEKIGTTTGLAIATTN